MNKLMTSLKIFTLLLLVALLSACGSKVDSAVEPADSEAPIAVLDVYKSPTCGCCSSWVAHLEAAGFVINTHHTEDLNQIKDSYGIEPRYQSCHTAISESGFVFEGHIPARYIQAFLENPPADARGLAVPGMPLGSPGMEVGDNFMPYQIWLLKQDGSAEIYASITNSKEQ